MPEHSPAGPPSLGAAPAVGLAAPAGAALCPPPWQASTPSSAARVAPTTDAALLEAGCFSSSGPAPPGSPEASLVTTEVSSLCVPDSDGTGSVDRGRRRGKRRSSPVLTTRMLRSRPPIITPVLPNVGLTVYTIGKGFKLSERQDLEEKIGSLHANPEVLALCSSISEAAERYLHLVHTSAAGWGYVAKRDTPSGVDVCFYSGVIRLKHLASGSNHCIDLGTIVGSPLVVDGRPQTPCTARTGSMQLVNHACRVDVPSELQGPNCEARHEMTDDTLGLWVLRTSRVIQKGEALCFDYGGSFWSSGAHDVSKAAHTLVRCRCAGNSCPKRRWRWERSSRSSSHLVDHEPSSRPPLQPRLLSWLTARETAQCDIP